MESRHEEGGPAVTKNLTTIAGIAMGAYVAMSIAIGLGLMIGAAAVWLRGA